MNRIVARAINTMTSCNPGLCAHAQHVAYLTTQVLKQVPHLANGYTKDEIVLAALLHDIGKSTWPPEWFSVPLNRLSATEIEQMRLHPVQGAQIAREMGVSEPIATLIAEHHEREGGKGYPRAITKPRLASLVIASCDVYAACREARPYRPRPLTVEQALMETAAVGCWATIDILKGLFMGSEKYRYA